MLPNMALIQRAVCLIIPKNGAGTSLVTEKGCPAREMFRLHGLLYTLQAYIAHELTRGPHQLS